MLNQADDFNWQVTVADYNLDLAERRVKNSDYGTAVKLNVCDEEVLVKTIAANDLIVFMLPPKFLNLIVNLCLKLGKNLATAYYKTEDLACLDQEIRSKNLIFLHELGLDSGLDHMSAMEVIDRIKKQGGRSL